MWIPIGRILGASTNLTILDRKEHRPKAKMEFSGAWIYSCLKVEDDKFMWKVMEIGKEKYLEGN